MNITEFSALKPGDEVTNYVTNGKGVVVEATKVGVGVDWSIGTVTVRHYTANTTSWMHWGKPTGAKQVPIRPSYRHRMARQMLRKGKMYRTAWFAVCEMIYLHKRGR